ncbi:MAG: S1 family peptidase [Nocardioides sp.]
MKWKTTIATAAAIAALVGGLAAANAASGADNHRDRTVAQDRVIAALQRDLGITAKQARRLGARQASAIALDARLRRDLDDAYAGSVFDSTTGRLTVMVSRTAAAKAARAAGADTELVERSRTELRSISADLDAAAGRTDRSADATRTAAPPSPSRKSALQSWYVDSASNTVRITARPGKVAEARRQLAEYGDAVTLVEATAPARPTDRYLDGGDGYNGNNCSVGITLRNPSTGQGYMLTAGHCVATGTTVSGHDGTPYGPVLRSFFPSYDDALVRNDSAGYWIQGRWVDTTPSHGSAILFAGYTDGPVGTVICKSGITTGYTCGTITAKNETVSYGSSGTVYGLTRHSACVERGDSGGANVSATYDGATWRYAAEGLTSGAQLWSGRCGQRVGQPNVSWYFPVADSLAYYGPLYGVGIS